MSYFNSFSCVCRSKGLKYQESAFWSSFGHYVDSLYIDRSIFVRLKWLVLVHLRYVSLVILVLYASFACFQVLRAKGANNCILESFGALLGTKWIAHVWAKMD